MPTTGIIFDIARCSLYDGPGIRTTVFFKGCPLRCLWCHNPESQDPHPELSYLKDKCVLCGACAAACPEKVHRFEQGRHRLERGKCRVCGLCSKACVYDALQVVGREQGSDSILAEVLKDKEYYQQSGGGITLSGGEPMMQFECAMELLKLAGSQGIHTCLETCGIAKREQYEAILPFVDLFLYDYKATDPVKHKDFTGASNDLVLMNLEFLCQKGAAVILRCPLVPGVNDSPDHLKGIASLSEKYPGLKGIEIMPYHDLGRDKLLRLGKAPTLPGLKTAEEETRQRWLRDLQNLGCVKIALG
ncbi:MAG: glycyl-radical enzyme activating protein [Bacillota bacterium]